MNETFFILDTHGLCIDITYALRPRLISALNEKERIQRTGKKRTIFHNARFITIIKGEERNWLKLLEHENIIEIYDTSTDALVLMEMQAEWEKGETSARIIQSKVAALELSRS